MFKLGDQVLIKPKEEIEYKHHFVDDMAQYCGGEATIEFIMRNTRDDDYAIRLSADDHNWWWRDHDLIPIDQIKIDVTPDDLLAFLTK